MFFIFSPSDAPTLALIVFCRDFLALKRPFSSLPKRPQKRTKNAPPKTRD